MTILAVSPLFSQQFGTTNYWLKDETTLSLTSDTSSWCFSGLRILIEPKIGGVQSTDDRNPIENSLFGAGGIGIETNIFRGWISVQGMVFAPSQVQFTPNSDLRGKGITKNLDGRVNSGIGLGLGVSVLNGIIAFGYSSTSVSSTEFFEGSENVPKSIGAYYLNIQPVSMIKNLFRLIKSQ